MKNKKTVSKNVTKKEVSKVAKKAPKLKKGINVVEMEITHRTGDVISLAFTGSKEALGLFVDSMGAGLKLLKLTIKGKKKI